MTKNHENTFEIYRHPDSDTLEVLKGCGRSWNVVCEIRPEPGNQKHSQSTKPFAPLVVKVFDSWPSHHLSESHLQYTYCSMYQIVPKRETKTSQNQLKHTSCRRAHSLVSWLCLWRPLRCLKDRHWCSNLTGNFKWLSVVQTHALIWTVIFQSACWHNPLVFIIKSQCWMHNCKALAIASNNFHRISKCSCPGN